MLQARPATCELTARASSLNGVILVSIKAFVIACCVFSCVSSV